jgi:hypothetical protein
MSQVRIACNMPIEPSRGALSAYPDTGRRGKSGACHRGAYPCGLISSQSGLLRPASKERQHGV